MSYKIPRDYQSCRYCQSEKTPCRDHRAEDGSYCQYNGEDVYEPSEWILSLLGRRFHSWDGPIYICTGYDPRAGIWMDAVDGSRRTNISESAIDRTWHPVTMKMGSWRLLELSQQNGGKVLSEEATEAADIIYDLALETLKDNGLVERIDAWYHLNDLGKQVLAKYPESMRHYSSIDFRGLDV